MAVVSVRLNKDEEKILDYLVNELHEEKSTIFKKSLFDKYEDIQDIKFIDQYIKDSKNKKRKEYTAEELLSRIRG